MLLPQAIPVGIVVFCFCWVAFVGYPQDDEAVSISGQPLISIADLQWVLYNAKTPVQLEAKVWRDRKIIPLTLLLEAGWRRGEDFTWRNHIWFLPQQIERKASPAQFQVTVAEVEKRTGLKRFDKRILLG